MASLVYLRKLHAFGLRAETRAHTERTCTLHTGGKRIWFTLAVNRVFWWRGQLRIYFLRENSKSSWLCCKSKHHLKWLKTTPIKTETTKGLHWKWFFGFLILFLNIVFYIKSNNRLQLFCKAIQLPETEGRSVFQRLMFLLKRKCWYKVSMHLNNTPLPKVYFLHKEKMDL